MSDAYRSQRDCESGPWHEVCKETKLGGTHVLKQEYVDAMWNRFSAIVLFATVSLKSRVSMRAAAILAQSYCVSNTTFVAEGRRVFEHLSLLGLLLPLSLVCISSHTFCAICSL